MFEKYVIYLTVKYISAGQDIEILNKENVPIFPFKSGNWFRGNRVLTLSYKKLLQQIIL